MSWTGNFKVEDISEGPAPIDVLVSCDNVTSSENIKSIEVKFVLDIDECPNLKIGDIMQVNGHFQP